MTRFFLYPVRTVVVLMTIYGLMVLNWLEGSLRFTSPRLNVLSLAIALCIPAVCPILLLVAPGRNTWRIGAAIALTLLAFPSVWEANNCLTFGKQEIVTDRDSGFFLLQTVPVSGAPTRIYDDPGWLDSPDTIVVRQEYTVLPGLIWIHELYKQDADRDVKVEVLDSHRFRCTFTAYETKGTSEYFDKRVVVLTAR